MLALVLGAVLGGPRLAALYSGEAVDLDEFVLGTVTRGELRREVRAPGTLVPTDLRWISAGVDGRVERIRAQAGMQVSADTVLMELSDPTLSQNVDAAAIELEVLQAQALVVEKRLVRDLLAQQALVAEIQSQYENAKFRMEANQALGASVSRLDLREWTLLERQFGLRLDIEQQRLDLLRGLRDAELQAQQAQVRRARSRLQLQQQLLAGLTVRAGIDGVLQVVPVEAGQRIATGALLARVAREDVFKTELRVQESQAKDVLLGQPVSIVAGGQEVRAKVSRIDPAVQEGVVLVDAEFVHGPPPGARPDLRVQGTIQIDHVEETLVLPRPVFSRENTAMGLFVIDEENRRARRVQVSLGIGSVDRIQVLEGLQAGERVIVSDTSRFDDVDNFVLAR